MPKAPIVLTDEIPAPPALVRAGLDMLPATIGARNERTRLRFIQFFTANIRNRNTRRAYARAVKQFFDWTEGRRLELEEIDPVTVAAYVEKIGGEMARPSVKQQLAAIRQMFDYLVTGGILTTNPAASVRGPKYVVRRGKTPVLSAGQARQLLDTIDVGELIGLRDRALIGLMVFSFARVGAANTLRVGDYFESEKRWWLRLHEKGGKRHEVPCHHSLGKISMTGSKLSVSAATRKAGCFAVSARGATSPRTGWIQMNVLRMIKRRAKVAGLPYSTCCHTFRATGITTYLKNGGTLEHAQQIAAHESPRTTKLYDRTNDQISVDEIERIEI